MNTTPIQPSFHAPATPALGDSLRAREARSFAEMLGRDTGIERGETMEQRARRAAEAFVATVFVAPVLKQLRESNGGAAPFAPSLAEKQMQTMLDSKVAENIVRAGDFPLVDRVAGDLLRAAGRGTGGVGNTP